MTVTRQPRPPVAARRPVSRRVHDTTLTDSYGWLRAENWQEALRDPSVLPDEIMRHLKAENRYTKAVLAETKPLQQQLFAEMKGRMAEDDEGVPTPDGPYDYYERYKKGGEYPLICRKHRATGKEELLLDGNKLARGKDYFAFGGITHAKDHRLIAWSCDESGNEYCTLRVRDSKTGKDLPDTIPNTDGGAVWSADGTALFYVWMDDNHRPVKLFRHVLGTPVEQDVLIHEEKDPTFFMGLHAAKAGDVAFITAEGSDISEWLMIDLRVEKPVPWTIAARERGEKYWVEYHPSYQGAPSLFIRSNRDGAEDYALYVTRFDALEPEHWQALLPHRPGVFLSGVMAFADWLVVAERENALPRLRIRQLSTGEEHTIAFDEQAYALFTEEGYEFETDTLRFLYASMTRPQETWDYDMRTREKILRKRQTIPSGHNPDDYVTERTFAPSWDGESVPVTLLYKKGTPRDGSAPLLLYGYGSYGSAMHARFNGQRLSLVDRGFVYAVAHIRGGMEKGYKWYRTGKLEHKTNTFKDFIASAEHLIQEGYTQKGRIVANGASAGGMLMGAIANMRPDLFAGIIADVPFVDVLNTILDDTLPLTPPEWTEWGDPIRDEVAFQRMRSYCPYSNVGAFAYPPILAIAGISDPRVTYWEPAKWVAKLRELSTSEGPILLHTEMSGGHGGASGRFDHLHEVALTYAFALKCVGMG